MKPTQEQVIAWANEVKLCGCKWVSDDDDRDVESLCDFAALAYEAGRAALATPPEELELPKVQLWEFLKLIEGKEDFRGIPLMRTEWPTQGEAQPEQEPVAWMHDSHVGFNVPLYTAPPQRDWQGLTDEEIEKLVYDIRSQTTGVVATVYVARAIEAKLREKNFDRPS